MEEETASVIIKFKVGEVQTNIDRVIALGAEIKHVYPSINAVSAEIPKNNLGNIQADANVEFIELDQQAHICVQSIPWGISKIRADQVWPSGNKGTGIKVCVIDTGIDYNHEDLKDNYKGGYNFLNNTNNPFDDHGHGTHVSGTIAAMDNSIGVIGVAPEAYIYSVKVLDSNGSGSYSNIIAGIQWAINNQMQIISMSLGGSSFSQALKDICDVAYNGGILIIAAAGNSGSDTDTIGYPAKFESCMAIGATDQNDVRASFSSVGPKLEVCGPGVSVLSTVPKGTCKMCDPSGYRQASGTSMATPHVSGAAALVLKAHPNLTNVDVREVLGNTAVHLGTPGRNIQYGYGRIDAKAAVDQIPPSPRYRCSGAPDFQCIEDPNGPYENLAACQAACKSPTVRYRCSGAPDFQCIEDPNGPYENLAACQAICKAPAVRYRCSGAPDFQCIEDPNGPYENLAACQAACKSPTARYRCSGSPDFQCIEDPNGPFPSLAECQAVCKAPAVRYRCSGSPDFQCIEDPNGPYMSLRECQAVCKAPQTKKFDVRVIGVPTNPSGILVTKSSRGNYTADEACKLVCDTLKIMDR